MQQLELILANFESDSKPLINITKPTSETVTQAEVETTPPEPSKPRPDILTLRKIPITYTAHQETALKEIAVFLSDSKESIYILSGYAGTGKTTIAENIVNYALAINKECIITAPTNQAVKVLKDKLGDIKVAFKTLHSTLYGCPDPDTGQWIPSVNFKADHVILVDEASMISETLYADLNHAIQAANAKVIFVGD